MYECHKTYSKFDMAVQRMPCGVGESSEDTAHGNPVPGRGPCAQDCDLPGSGQWNPGKACEQCMQSPDEVRCNHIYIRAHVEHGL